MPIVLTFSQYSLLTTVAYPNPLVSGETINLYYEVSGETAGVSAQALAPAGAYDPSARVALKITTRTGRVIWQTSLTGVKAGGNSYGWDVLDLKNAPLANGVYFYTVTVSGKDQTSTKTAPLVILR
jgi:hypothetical protein